MLQLLMLLTTLSVVGAQNPLGPNGKGAELVDWTVLMLDQSEIFADDFGFMRRIACAESLMGTAPGTYTKDNGRGIWQVDQVGFADTQLVSSHPGLKAKFQQIADAFRIDWPSLKYDSMNVPLYNALAARLKLYLVPEAIPQDLNDQAYYWKKYYNTVNGAGTAQKFIDAQSNTVCQS